jgi:hypothetical protein
MNMISIRRLSQYMMSASLIILLASCGGGGGDNSADGDNGNSDNGNSDNTTAKPEQLSTREKFIAVRGNPDLFSIMFLDNESTSNSAHERRRLETWFYDGADAKSVIFDNGYFVEELTEADARLSLADLSMKPSDITSDMSTAEIKGLYGEPYDEETQQLFGRSYLTMKYRATNNIPIITFVLIDSRIASVSVGFELEYEPGDEEDLIITPVN